MELTPKQQRLFSFMKSKSTDAGKTARVTMQDMAKYMGVGGPPSVSGMVNAIIAKGYMVRDFPEAPGEGITYTFIK